MVQLEKSAKMVRVVQEAEVVALLRHEKAVGDVAVEVWVWYLKEDVTEGSRETAAVGAHVVLADSKARVEAEVEASLLMKVHSSGLHERSF